MKYISRLIFLSFVASFLTGCSEQRDRNGILSEKAMIDVLYDYQLALALASEDARDGNLAEVEYRYTQSVMKKHGLTDDEFNLSLAHYARDPKQLLRMTELVSKRLVEELDKPVDENKVSASTVQRDTMLLWQNRPGFLLAANQRNRVHLDIPLSGITSCDKLLFSLQTDWVYREGNKQGTVMLQVVFDNDSVAMHKETLRDYNHQSAMYVQVPSSRKVKQIGVDIYQSAFWQNYRQILSVSNLAFWAVSDSKKAPEDSKNSNDAP